MPLISDFPALPGLYQLLFLHIEPTSTALPALMAWLFPGAAWFHHELIPDGSPIPAALDPRTTMAIWQLGNCYLLLGMISTFVFRAVRDALPGNPAAQERIMGASFLALALADVTHILWSFVGLPAELKYDFARWNSMTHGNITFVVFLLSMRLAWFAGIGRKRYYFGQPAVATKKRS
ncbi:uncharacterized protein TRAVEDRAFT_68765 [Trametes versicolor FP-101664 SS1]|uniref:uncharacterized protein n=1 Tax=Trametes versicolor (strain FP-101664) TaxID=717944 RepID=UPI00046220A2|nr:uncharacterized protein TRAVEDRAFT_68765 [Trametes versicolor FP-101664 SS1]EIW65221.1 hypothetical protein TRAVEDRAFT_68765 [Trametes versicolor FP-101664 SS1]